MVDGLKEDTTVDIPTTMTSIQLLLIWLLMGLLLTWMIVFALLALKPERGKKAELFSASKSSFPQLHVIIQQQSEKSAIDIQLEAATSSTSRARR